MVCFTALLITIRFGTKQMSSFITSSHFRRKVPARLQTSAQFVRITTVGSAHYRILCFRDCTWGVFDDVRYEIVEPR